MSLCSPPAAASVVSRKRSECDLRRRCGIQFGEMSQRLRELYRAQAPGGAAQNNGRISNAGPVARRRGPNSEKSEDETLSAALASYSPRSTIDTSRPLNANGSLTTAVSSLQGSGGMKLGDRMRMLESRFATCSIAPHELAKARGGQC